MKVGILGGGQLAQMLIQAGRELGVKFEVFTSEQGCPAGQLAEVTVGSFNDQAQMVAFFKRNHFITYENENLSVELLQSISENSSSLFPSANILEVISARFSQKQFFHHLGIPTAPVFFVENSSDVPSALEKVGVPGIFKTNRLGYDGKGQKQITCLAEGVTVWNDLGSVPLVYEQWIPFERELSLVACRDRFGKMVFYPLVENIHKKGILELTWAPAENVSPDLQRLAESYAVSVCQKINYVGVLALELFQWGTQLLINEMASRVHNTGHWSIEGAQTSQFENHLRAGLGLSLGDPQPCGYSAMLNLIGTIPAQIEQLKKEIGVFVHLYGKNPQPGRKLGHITVVSENTHSLKDKLNRVRGICGI